MLKPLHKLTVRQGTEHQPSFESVLHDIQARDVADTTRPVGALRQVGSLCMMHSW